ncbi:hypothetical protein vseg_017798 [Gypsophila vaccaria]
MKQKQITKFIFINKIMKKPKLSYILSLIFFSISLAFITLYATIPSSFHSVVSDLKFSFSRTHMFLLCNGILVILVKSSPSSSSTLSSVSQDFSSVNYDSTRMAKQISEVPVVLLENNASVITENFVVVQEFECGDDNNDACNNDHNNRNDGGDHEEEEEAAAAEELNRRCEDFIRRMKQGIISESRFN